MRTIDFERFRSIGNGILHRPLPCGVLKWYLIFRRPGLQLKEIITVSYNKLLLLRSSQLAG